MRRARLLLTLLFCFGLVACRPLPGQPTTPPPPATQVVVTTRLLALLGPAELALNDGCLRAGEHALVWPPEFSVSVEGSQVTVADSYTGERAVWRLGDAVWLGGGEISRAAIDAEAGQRWLGNCEAASAYWLVGGINVTIPATGTIPAPSPTTRSAQTATLPFTPLPTETLAAIEGMVTSTMTLPAPISTVRASTATHRPLTATSTPIPPTQTAAPTATAASTACAFAWFMANPPAGCPDQPAVYAQTIAQRFERGLLLWRAIPDTYGSQIYAFFADGQWPAWNPTNDRWRPDLPESDPGIVPPVGFYQPVRGFGLFWRDAFFNPAGAARDRLGWAVEPETSIGGRPLQCRVQGDWAAGCFVGGPGDQILLVEGNNAWSTWIGPAP